MIGNAVPPAAPGQGMASRSRPAHNRRHEKSGEPLPWANGIAPAPEVRLYRSLLSGEKDIAPLRADCVTHV